MREIEFYAPTYNANVFPEDVEIGRKLEYGEPIVPVLVRDGENLRVVLGAHVCPTSGTPHIQIERHPNGWQICLCPVGGNNESGCVWFLDDGRSFLKKVSGLGPTEAIGILESGEELPEFDAPPRKRCH